LARVHHDSVGPLVPSGDAPGGTDGFQKWDSTGTVVDEEDPPLGPVSVRDRGLGEDSQGVRDPVDDDYVAKGFAS
jgi:hypothetical protein